MVGVTLGWTVRYQNNSKHFVYSFAEGFIYLYADENLSKYV